MTNNLKLLIDSALANNGGSNNIKLTGEQLLELVNSRRASIFQLGKQYSKYDGPESDMAYQGYACIQITRKQALNVATDFKNNDKDTDGSQLYYRVYVSKWNSWKKDKTNELYINL